MTNWADLVFSAGPPEATRVQAQTNWADEVFGVSGRAPEAAKATLPPGAEPDANTWFGRRVQDIRGKQDPRFKDVPTYMPERMLSGQDAAMIGGKLFAGNDAAYGDILAKSLGDRLIKREKDANGYEVMTYRDEQGQTKQGYVNKPGLDLEDANRAVFGAIPYVLGAKGVNRLFSKSSVGPGGPIEKTTAGLGIRMLFQGGAAGATSVGTDIAAGAAGSDQGVDPTKAAVMTGFGAGGEMVSPAINAIVRRFWTEPRLFNRSAGTLTQEGEKIARASGLDPAELTAEMAKSFAQTYAKTGSPAVAGMKTRAGDLPVTKGQLTKDPEQLLQEKGMRYGLYGDQAKLRMTMFDEQQKQAVASKVGASGDPVNPGMIERLGGNATTRFGLPGQDIQAGVRTARAGAKDVESAAWKGTEGLTATPEAFAEMPKIMERRLGGFRVDAENTPIAHRMGKALDEFAAGGIPEPSSKMLGSAKPMTVDDMRKRLGAMVAEAAQSPSDKSAAGAIYDGFNDWIAEAAKKQLLGGNPEAAAKLVTARDISREINGVFKPRDIEMRRTPGAQVIKDVLTKETPEQVVDALFTGQTRSQIKNGSVEALNLIKRGLDQYAPPEVAKSTWNSVRIAYWMRIVQNKQGDINSPQVILSNLKSAMTSQRSVVSALYTPSEQKQMRDIARQMEAITWKDPNPSGSGTAIASYSRQLLQTLFAWVGESKVLRTGAMAADKVLGVSSGFGGAAAAKAVSQKLPAKPAGWSGGWTGRITGAGAANERATREGP